LIDLTLTVTIRYYAQNKGITYRQNIFMKNLRIICIYLEVFKIYICSL
jgi:hypothetical protein